MQEKKYGFLQHPFLSQFFFLFFVLTNNKLFSSISSFHLGEISRGKRERERQKKPLLSPWHPLLLLLPSLHSNCAHNPTLTFPEIKLEEGCFIFDEVALLCPGKWGGWVRDGGMDGNGSQSKIVKEEKKMLKTEQRVQDRISCRSSKKMPLQSSLSHKSNNFGRTRRITFFSRT